MNRKKVNQPTEDAAPHDDQATDLATDMLFPSIVFRQQLHDSRALNASLLQSIMDERAKDEAGLQVSNYVALGGWHSRFDLQTEASFKPLVDAIEAVAEEIARRFDYHPSFKLRLDQMWAVVNPPGALNGQHIHPHSLWSGVYYVQVPDDAGMLQLNDPRPGYEMFCAQHRPAEANFSQAKLSVFYEPVEGHLILFPGFLPHSVAPNQSNETGRDALRVAISFNLAQH